jgi:hypothetical protein
MKKKFLILLIIIFGLTGCIKNNINMKLETDNSFSITIINSTMGNDTGNNNTLSSDSSTEELFNKQKYIDNGFKVEDYDDGSYAGIKVIAEFASIDSVSDPSIDIIELTELVNNKVEDIKLFKSEKVENGTKYTANFTYNLDDDSLKDATSSYNVDISSYGDIMELEYSITLPYKLENENSTSHSGNTYKWKLNFGEVNIIKFSFIVKDEDITDEKNEYEEGTETDEEIKTTYKGSITDIIPSIILIVVVIVVVVILHHFKKKILNKKVNKIKKNGYHVSAPDSIKEKK